MLLIPVQPLGAGDRVLGFIRPADRRIGDRPEPAKIHLPYSEPLFLALQEVVQEGRRIHVPYRLFQILSKSCLHKKHAQIKESHGTAAACCQTDAVPETAQIHLPFTLFQFLLKLSLESFISKMKEPRGRELFLALQEVVQEGH